MNHRCLLPLILLLPSLWLTGCATSQDAKGKGAYSGLYKGRSTLAYATRFPSESAEEAVRRADAALADGNRDLALYEYVQSLEMDPKNPAVFYRIGLIHDEQQHYDIAARAYALALEFDKQHAGALEGMGLIALRNRAHRKAEELLSQAVAADGRLWRSYNGLGIVADLDGKHEQAIEHFGKAAELQPNLALLHNNRGYSRYLAGDFEGAVRDYRKALSADQGFKKAWENLGLVHARQGRYREAIEALTHSMDKAAAYNDVGFVCLSQGEFTLAERFFHEAAKLSPKYYDAAYRNLDRVRSRQARNE